MRHARDTLTKIHLIFGKWLNVQPHHGGDLSVAESHDTFTPVWAMLGFVHHASVFAGNSHNKLIRTLPKPNLEESFFTTFLLFMTSIARWRSPYWLMRHVT
ncbi:hypothetical protein SCLCIDRAFT_153537 [Scleroderma citrinum Foug A]|uniref:Uncharacterized protein n=1 Tax=Scleroderma citrinum Foug A TaxID=1036808 RepID=A0A0C3ECW2_9AGAM|nr:hypothetical protein SCLCIDRAFT_153537 [Scleroderma citrinum Foug A]